MTLVDHGFRLPSALDNWPMKFDEWEAKNNQICVITCFRRLVIAEVGQRIRTRAIHWYDLQLDRWVLKKSLFIATNSDRYMMN
jgi:hypothetical protein